MCLQVKKFEFRALCYPQAELSCRFLSSPLRDKLLIPGGIQPQYDSDYHFWARNVWRPNLTFLASVLSKTLENESFNKKLHNSYSKVRTQRTFYLTTKLIF